MKKLFCTLLLVILNFSLFANPMNGGSPIKGGTAPGDDKKHGGVFGGNPSGPPRGPGANPPPDKKPDSAPPKPSDKKNITHNNSDRNSRNTLNYRGQRIIPSDKEPEIIKTKLIRSSENSVKITLYFNQPVNPVKFNSQNVIVNKLQISDDTKMLFNKKGDNVTFEINIPQKTSDILLELQNLEGINGKKVDAIKVAL